MTSPRPSPFVFVYCQQLKRWMPGNELGNLWIRSKPHLPDWWNAVFYWQTNIQHMIYWTGNIRTSMNITILNNYKKQPSAPLHPLSWPKQLYAWSRLHLDFTGPLFNHNVPCGGGCPHQIDPMPNSTSFSTIQLLRTLFTQFGIHQTSCGFRQCSLQSFTSACGV